MVDDNPVTKIPPTFDRDLIAFIQNMIRTKTAVYNIIPPAKDTQAFITKLYNQIQEEKPEDVFEYIDKKVDEWYQKNKTKWISEIEPRRVKSIVKKLTSALRMRSFSLITDDDLRLIREYIEILPELEDLRNSVAEVLHEMVLGPMPSTSKVGLTNLRRIIEHPEFRDIAYKIGIGPIVDEAIKRLDELLEELEMGTVSISPEQADSLAIEITSYIRSRNYQKIDRRKLRLLNRNIDMIKPTTIQKLRQAVHDMLEKPPTAKGLIDRYIRVVQMPEFV